MSKFLSAFVVITSVSMANATNAAATPLMSVCTRTQVIQDEIVQQVAKPCGEITAQDLAAIVELNFRSAQTVHSLSAGDFQGMISLRTLNLLGNNIKDLPSGVFAGLSSLEQLMLGENKIEELPKNVFADLTSLENLTLNDNQIKVISGNVFQGLTRLRTLWLHSNPLVRLPAELLRGLSQMHELFLGGALEEIPEKLFQDTPALYQLTIHSWGSLKALPPKLLHGLTKLGVLGIDGGDFKTVPEGFLFGLNSLWLLELPSNGIAELPSTLLRDQKKVWIINLAGNYLTKLPQDIFKGLEFNEAINEVYLQNNFLTDIPPATFAWSRIPKYLMVDFTHNLLPPETKSRLKAQLGSHVRGI
jgi:Leucine-rich repeat (LRR) protein